MLHIAADSGLSSSKPGIRIKVMQAVEPFRRNRKLDAKTLEASVSI